jgi:hypothetical protein
MMKSALVAVRLARAAGFDEETQRASYYLGLIRMVGCTATSAADAELFGDELTLIARVMLAIGSGVLLEHRGRRSLPDLRGVERTQQRVL